MDPLWGLRVVIFKMRPGWSPNFRRDGSFRWYGSESTVDLTSLLFGQQSGCSLVHGFIAQSGESEHDVGAE